MSTDTAIPPVKASRSARPKDRVTKAVSLSSDLVQWAESQAQEDNRTLSNFVETLLLAKKHAAEVEAA